MAQFLEDNAFNALEVRDTNLHESVNINTREMRVQTIIIYNLHNQIATLTFQGSRDGITWLTIGTVDVPASTNNFQTCDSFFPFVRVLVQYASSPSSGSISLWYLKTGGGL